MNAYERVAQVLQELLNAEGDGWTLSHWIGILGIERMNGDGAVDSAVWICKPADQAEYVTDGLISSAFDARLDYSTDD